MWHFVAVACEVGFDGFCFVHPGVAVDIEEKLDVFVGNVEAGGVEVFDGWQIADGGFMGAGFTVGAIEDPFEDADVFAVAWPDDCPSSSLRNQLTE